MSLYRNFFSIVALSLTLLSANAENSSWMKNIPDDTKVRDLSIPGAHDAATGNGFAASAGFLAAFSGVTQALPLADQWDAGIRAFDLRPAYPDYKEDTDVQLTIFHGVLETKVALKDALDILVEKLKVNDSEFAVLLFRHETEGDRSSAMWASAMAELLAGYTDYICPFSPTMDVKDARGKMIILSRDNFSLDGLGEISGWSHSENLNDQRNARVKCGRNSGKLYVQDFYECQTVERKVAAVNTLINYRIGADDKAWIINHVSGYTGSTGTNSAVLNLAKGANPEVKEHILFTESRTPAPLGIMMMDFAGAEKAEGNALTDCIIAHNATYISMAGVDDIQVDSDPHKPIYTIDGICVGYGAEALSGLPKGLYIYDGKKIIL